jgi:AraC family transcriptional regulator
MSAIEKTLWLIESRFRDTVPLDDLALHAGLSRSYLSRLFQIATGYSISAYVRGRRLTEAAKTLAGGAPDILAVALDAGYGSHEAFTRAFGEQFGLTPDELRRRRSLSSLPLVEALNMTTLGNVHLAPPSIDRQPALKLAGLGQRYDAKTMANIPDQWTRFGPFISDMAQGRPGIAFGVVGRMDEEVDGFDYFCGIPAPDDVPHGVALRILPAARYARFRHENHISTIRATCAAIFEQWLPDSGEEQDHERFSFLEHYGPDFDPHTGLGTVEVWLALKD